MRFGKSRIFFFYFSTIFQKGIDKFWICGIINKVGRFALN